MLKLNVARRVLAENLVHIDLGKYRDDLRNYLRDSIVRAEERQRHNRAKQFDHAALARLAIKVGWHEGVQLFRKDASTELLRSWISWRKLHADSSNFDDVHELSRAIMGIVDKEELPPRNLSQEHKGYMQITTGNMTRLANRVEAAIRRVPNWESIVRFKLLYDLEDSLEGHSAIVHVAQSNMQDPPSFSIFADGSVDDVLDAGDTDFFDVNKPSLSANYFDLVAEIQHPGSSSRVGKAVVVYTARPVRDRDLYDAAKRTKRLPSNIFVASNLSHVEGLGRDLAGTDDERDLYAIRVLDNYLITTLDTARVREYQLFDPSGHVPILSIQRF